MFSKDIEQGLGKMHIARQVALSILGPKLRQLVDQHMDNYVDRMEQLGKLYGGVDKIPVEVEDKASDLLFAEHPDEFAAMTALARLENKILESGRG